MNEVNLRLGPGLDNFLIAVLATVSKKKLYNYNLHLKIFSLVIHINFAEIIESMSKCIIFITVEKK